MDSSESGLPEGAGAARGSDAGEVPAGHPCCSEAQAAGSGSQFARCLTSCTPAAQLGRVPPPTKPHARFGRHTQHRHSQQQQQQEQRRRRRAAWRSSLCVNNKVQAEACSSAHRPQSRALHAPRTRNMAPSLWLLLAAVAVLGPQLLPGVAAECRSDYCSVGKLEGVFRGDIAKPEAMAKALKSASYKREIIIVATGHAVGYVDMALQLYDELVSHHQLAHMLLLTASEKDCMDVVAKLAPSLSCAWDSSPLSFGVTGVPALWHLRDRVVARAGRLGYNVMCLDSDVLVFRDPYTFLKQAPLKDVNFLCGHENWRHMAICNSGFMYVQNVKPDGPTMWIFKDATELPLQWLDDDLAFINTLGKKHTGVCFAHDQAFIDQSLGSTIIGRPTWVHAVGGCWGDTYHPEGAPHETKQTVAERLFSQINFRERSKKELPPFPWSGDTPSEQDWPLETLTIQVPNSRGGVFPPDLGGRVSSAKGGKYSGAFLDQLKGDCPTCPAWPETDAKDEAKAANTTEVFGVAHGWFFGPAMTDAHKGKWMPQDGETPRQVMGHVHYVPVVHHPSTKTAMRKLVRRYNWDLGEKVAAADIGGAHGTRPTHTAYQHRHAVEKVVALSPELDLNSMVRSTAELHLLIASLFQVGLLSRRTVALPDIPCQSCWKHMHPKNEAGKDEPERCSCEYGKMIGRMYFDVVNLMRSTEGGRTPVFTPMYYFHEPCLLGNRPHGAIFGAEFEHWRSTLEKQSGMAAVDPGPNTIVVQATELKDMARNRMRDNRTLADLIPTLDAADLTRHMDLFNDKPLVYLGHPMMAEPQTMPPEAQKKFEHMHRHCLALRIGLKPWADERAKPVPLAGAPGVLDPSTKPAQLKVAGRAGPLG